ncbi:MAG: sigma 54-interacting transcriptional regulator [Isosphaeraceae bacterium]|nr:sigma 54-interacting transcriptional regulator [Isosphaeraceae bacterium]
MALLSTAKWRSAKAISKIGYVNPFLPERIELEKKALGPAYREEGPILRKRLGETYEDLFGNVPAMRKLAQELIDEIRERIEAGASATRDELLVYENLSLYSLYARFMNSIDGIVSKEIARARWDGKVPFWDEFASEFDRLFHLPRHELPSRHDPAVVFAGFHQIERAFSAIYHRIFGGSMPAARLRADVWQSIFTRDMNRYIRSLHRVMSKVPTLILGPSGSGKELVASAVGRSCFIPFNKDSRSFDVGASYAYVPINISALSGNLIESELFGHKAGSFTGATKDRVGRLATCGPSGAVFLDEIGELDLSIQVKLLRVIQNREFTQVGGNDAVAFQGKFIAATNRDLEAEIAAGRFRHDLYYRLCADQIATPSLAEQLSALPEDLREMVRFVVEEIFRGSTGESTTAMSPPPSNSHIEEDVELLTDDAVDWIERELGFDYAWPGNFRELGQCVRNVMIRGSYRRAASRKPMNVASPVDRFLESIRGTELSERDLVRRYRAYAYHRSGKSYAAAASILKCDWRLIKQHDTAFLDELE